MNASLIKKMQSQMKNNQSENDSVNDSVNEDSAAINAKNEQNINDDNEFVNDDVNEIFVDDNEGINDDENVEVITSKTDPLDQYIQEPEPEPIPEKTTVAETIQNAAGDSAKNAENLATLGELVLDFIDDGKAHLCAAISGEHAAEYAGDKKAKAALLEAFKVYIGTMGVGTPSPFWTFMLAIGVWGAPTLGAAYWHKVQKDKAKAKFSEVEITYIKDLPTTNNHVQSEPVEQKSEPAKKDYSHLKEVQTKRKLFTIHKTAGVYNRTPDGTFSKISLSSEKPSPEIQFLIAAGKTCAEIREIIYNE